MHSPPFAPTTPDGESGTIFVVDDDGVACTILQSWLEAAGHRVEVFHSGEACLKGLSRAMPDVLCLDIHMPGLDGLQTLKRIRTIHPSLPVIMLTTDQNVASVVSAMRSGAFDYLNKPVDTDRLGPVIRNAIQQHRMAVRLVELEHEAHGWRFSRLIGRSEPMVELYRRLDRVAGTDVTVLVEGESGTGKELVARTIHERSGRASGPFVAVNCAAIPDSLQESELFGHEKGAFTGADRRRAGRFEQADGGTLFLDEIGELSTAAQAKVLRALQERSFHRVGGADEVTSDFRLLAATHRSLDEEAAHGRFRRDLFYRLAVFELRVPPLRERAGDVETLARAFARELGLEVAGRQFTVTPPALTALAAYPWPGNVRELENAVRHAAVLSPGEEITLDCLPARIRRGAPPARTAGRREPTPHDREGPRPAAETSDRTTLASTLDGLSMAELERMAIERALEREGGNVTRAAESLGIGRATVYRKMARYGLTRREE